MKVLCRSYLPHDFKPQIIRYST